MAPTVDDIVVPDPLRPGEDLELVWDAGDADVVVVEIAATGFPDCASVTTCALPDAGSAVIDAAHLPDPHEVWWDSVAGGRSRATRREIGRGAIVGVRATSWVVVDVP